MTCKAFLYFLLMWTVSAQEDGLGSYASTGQRQQIAIAPTITKNIPSPNVFGAPIQTRYFVVNPTAETFSNSPPLIREAIPVVERHLDSYSNSHTPGLAAVVAPRLASPEYSPASLIASSFPQQHQEDYAHPIYEYGYSIEDHHSGDVHSQQEQRNGEQVAGQYSLREADGTIRIVKYFDDGHGFNAVVERKAGA